MARLDEALARMVEHARENPSHGYNCACKDEFIRIARTSIENNALVEQNAQYLAWSIAR